MLTPYQRMAVAAIQAGKEPASISDFYKAPHALRGTPKKAHLPRAKVERAKRWSTSGRGRSITKRLFA